MAAKTSATNKARTKKIVSAEGKLGQYDRWLVFPGELKRAQGRPGGPACLFEAIAEKIPKAALGDLCKHLSNRLGRRAYGVYVAHDSMGYPRYVGRGDLKARLTARFQQQKEELMYFSVYVIPHKTHEREVETLLIHAAGSLLDFNGKKKRNGIQAASVRDFEAGTHFYERRYMRGRK